MAKMRLIKGALNNVAEGICIVKSVSVRSNSKGSDYLDIVLADADGEITAKLWDFDPVTNGVFYPDMIVKVRGTVTLWKDVEQLRVDRIRETMPEDGVDMSALVPCAPFDSEWMFDQLMECAAGFADHDLTRLVQYILKQNKTALLKQPAALKLHHAQHGGLLYHTLTMLRAATALSGIYPALDSDLVYAGVILHDIEKINELIVGPLGIASGYSVAGQLVGHIAMGVAMVEQAASELQMEGELPTLLSHMLLSHHGTPEFGSPRPPMFPEAEVLHQLDVLDSKLFEMFAALDGVEKGGFSERVWALDNRQLYQHGHNAPSISGGAEER